ncbi:hypothetical protein D9Q98_004934 [Chlorella vulgaris]|uniref:C3H1-type domain-containing protein n=1 Tax=Chlorella vulgaris TaxID=3077 RepID=A0A9D4TPH4_CHLVU|nr:hypothetical protein D9Q98_004934 [Chlorella vulgaris]
MCSSVYTPVQSQPLVQPAAECQDDPATKELMRSYKGEKARRRDQTRYKYTGIACPNMRQNNHCSLADNCPYAHNVFEYWLHPTRYRTQLCNDGTACKRKLCFFAHGMEQLRNPKQPIIAPGALLGAATAAAAGGTTGLDPRPSANHIPQQPSLQAQLAPPAPLPMLQRPAPALPQAFADDQGQLQVVQQLASLLDHGQLSLDCCAAILERLLPTAALQVLQGAASPSYVASQPCRYSDPVTCLSAVMPLGAERWSTSDVPLGANWMSGLARDALLSPEVLALQLGGGAPQQEPDASACMAQCLGVLPDDLYPACQPASAKHQQQRDIWALSAATLAPAWDSRSSLDSDSGSSFATALAQQGSGGVMPGASHGMGWC